MAKTLLSAAMSPMERRQASNQPPSLRDQAVSKKQFSNYLNEVLATGVPSGDFDEEGNPICIPLGKKLVAARLAYMLDHPEDFQLTEIAKASSAGKVEVSVGNGREALDFFSCLPDDTDGATEVEVLSDDTGSGD